MLRYKNSYISCRLFFYIPHYSQQHAAHKGIGVNMLEVDLELFQIHTSLNTDVFHKRNG